MPSPATISGEAVDLRTHLKPPDHTDLYHGRLESFLTLVIGIGGFGIIKISTGRKLEFLAFQKAREQEKLLDMVDKYTDDIQAHAMEVVEMMKVVSWCLQSDFTRTLAFFSIWAKVKAIYGSLLCKAVSERNKRYWAKQPLLRGPGSKSFIARAYDGMLYARACSERGGDDESGFMVFAD